MGAPTPTSNSWKAQEAPLTKDLPVSLEDIAKGTVKKVDITRKVLSADGWNRTPEKKTFSIKIEPGWKTGTKITFPREGDQKPGHIPADVVFILKDEKHPLFTREGPNIRYTVTLSLQDALCGTSVYVPSLEEAWIPVTLDEIVGPKSTKKIEGKGLPYPKDPSKLGDLIIAFDIKFPQSINQATKEVLRDVLPTS